MSEEKYIHGECSECESVFTIQYLEMLSSTEYPEYCPFCGEPIDQISEDYIEDEDNLDNDQWN